MKANLLEVLACPICLGELQASPSLPEIDAGRLDCTQCGAVYPVTAGLPILLLKDELWEETSLEVEGEQQFVHELPFSEHIKRNHFESRRTQELMERVSIPPNPRVLDVGGSTGFAAYLFKPFDPEVVVTDIVPFFVQLAEACLGGCMKVHGVPSGVEWLPFRDDSFDVVFCRQALHHSLEPPVAVGEMFRVAKPGGLVLIASEPCLSSADLYRKWRDDKRRRKNPGDRDDLLSKLPDEQFAHGWPTFRKWFSQMTDDFEIIPAGGSAATILTENGLVYLSHYRERQWVGRILNRILPGRRGFRGDIHIIARKTRPVSRRAGRPRPRPIREGEWTIEPLTAETIESQREAFVKMFPFPVEI